MTTFFKSFANINELKNQYRTLAFELHPDKGGSNEDFQAMSNEYQELLKDALKGKFNDTEKVNSEMEIDELMRDALNKIIHLLITIEIVGNWIWLTGNTYSVKDEIKKAGFKFAGKKKAWYWNDGTFTKKTKKQFSLNDIKNKYGSKKIETKYTYQLR